MNTCRVYFMIHEQECGRPSTEHCATDPAPEHVRACSLAHHPFSLFSGSPRLPRGRAGVPRSSWRDRPAKKANPSFLLLLAAAPAAGPYDWMIVAAMFLAGLSAGFSFLAWFSGRLERRDDEQRSLRLRRDEVRQRTEEVLP